jgi:hypothetical protein
MGVATQGPLGSFWAKIQLSFALRIISQRTYEDLETIRELRNMFAHQYGAADFNDPAVVSVCERLKAADLAVRAIQKQEATLRTESKSRGKAVTGLAPGPPLKKERVRFAMSASWIAATFKEAFSSRSSQLTILSSQSEPPAVTSPNRPRG